MQNSFSPDHSNPTAARTIRSDRLPRILTWIVAKEGAHYRSLCLQASSPSRQRSFRRRYSPVIQIDRPIGCDCHGRPMDQDALRVLIRGIYRNHGADHSVAMSCENARIAIQIIDRVAAYHGMLVSDLLHRRLPARRLSQVRGHAAHELRKNLSLSHDKISNLLKMHPSTVGYWLQQPLSKLRQLKRQPKPSRPRGGFHD